MKTGYEGIVVGVGMLITALILVAVAKLLF